MTIINHQQANGFPSGTPSQVWHADTWLNVTDSIAEQIRTLRMLDDNPGTNWTLQTGMCTTSGHGPSTRWRVSAYRTDAAEQMRALLQREPDETAMRPYPDPDHLPRT